MNKNYLLLLLIVPASSFGMLAHRAYRLADRLITPQKRGNCHWAVENGKYAQTINALRKNNDEEMERDQIEMDKAINHFRKCTATWKSEDVKQHKALHSMAQLVAWHDLQAQTPFSYVKKEYCLSQMTVLMTTILDNSIEYEKEKWESAIERQKLFLELELLKKRISRR